MGERGEGKKKVQFGIVGTSWISESFVKASRQVEGVNVIAIFSRNAETALNFASKTDVHLCYTDYNEMLNNNDITSIYIASPNSLHYHYAKEAILHNKSVLCEKPFTSNANELEQLLKLAEEKKIFIMEAIKTISMPSYQSLVNSLPKVGKIRHVNFQKSQFSSKYPEYLAAIASQEESSLAKVHNVFKKDFSGGGLMDIGVYCVYPALHLFSKPLSIYSTGTILETGVDGAGVSLWQYDGFQAVITYSKIANSPLPSEILGEKGTLLIDSISNPTRIEFVSLKGEKEIIFENLDKESMAYEIEEFVSCLNKGLTQSPLYSHQLALLVMQSLDTIRQQLNVVYPSDNQQL